MGTRDVGGGGGNPFGNLGTSDAMQRQWTTGNFPIIGYIWRRDERGKNRLLSFEFIYFLFPFLPVRETLRDCPCFGGRGKERKKGRTSGGVGGTFFPPSFPTFLGLPFSLSLSLVSSEGRERERERAAAALGDFRAVDSGATWCQNRTFFGWPCLAETKKNNRVFLATHSVSKHTYLEVKGGDLKLSSSQIDSYLQK